MSLNRVVLIGRLVNEPDLRYSQSGVAIANFTVAVDRPYQNQRGDKETDFVPVLTFRKLAEICAENLTKGRLVAVEGRLQISRYESNGQKKMRVEVVAETVQFLDRAKNGRQGSKSVADNDAGPGDEVPF